MSISSAAEGCRAKDKGDGMDYRFVSVLGKRLRYVERGEGAAVLYVHGNLGSCLWWRDVMDLPGRRTVALDMPNFGGSEAMDVADLDAYADHVEAFAEALGLGRFALVGHSLGGGVAMALAARYPDSVSALALIDGAAPSGLKTPEEHYPYIELYRSNRDFLKRGLAAVVPALKDEAFLEALVDEGSRMAGHAFAGNARALERFDYRGRAGAYTGPVLVVRGELDVIITDAMAEETASAYKHARLVRLEGLGHSPMVEAPEVFISLLSEFLSQSGR